MKVKSIHLIIIIFLLAVIISYFNSFEKLEYLAQDSLFQRGGDWDTRIVVIAIDDESLEKLGRWPWSRKIHAELIDTLAKGNPAVIFLDMILSEPSDDPGEDGSLAKAVKNFGRVIIPSYGVLDKTAKGGLIAVSQIVEPVPVLKENALQAHINTFQDSDGIVRRTLPRLVYNGEIIESAALKAYRTYAETVGEADISKNIPVDEWNMMYIHYTGEPQSVEFHSYHRVLEGEIPPEYFEDKIVLVGPYTVGIGDYYLTSIDHQVPMYGVEIHANIIQNLLHGSFKKEVGFAFTLVILVLFTMLGSYAFKRLSPVMSALLLIAGIALYAGAAVLVYGTGYILPVVYPVSLYFVIYLITLAYRYINELFERKRITSLFSRYVAPQVVGKIVAGGEEALKLGGSRRELTVLFVDIRGFTPLSERAEPEEVVAILNEYLTLCAESIFKYNGTLDKFIGDATMALFNAPLDLEDHAFNAVQAAWAMKRGAEPLKKKLEEKFGKTVEFGIGINTGEAVVGNIGAVFRMDYTAIGDTVNTAARLESNARPGQILMSQSTYERVKDRVKATFMGEYTVKGKTHGIPVYQLDGLQ